MFGHWKANTSCTLANLMSAKSLRVLLCEIDPSSTDRYHKVLEIFWSSGYASHARNPRRIRRAKCDHSSPATTSSCKRRRQARCNQALSRSSKSSLALRCVASMNRLCRLNGLDIAATTAGIYGKRRWLFKKLWKDVPSVAIRPPVASPLVS